ncbi:cupin domain-containing protein [Streptomyces albus]|uniref:cupin domain-containing protein n=1 Tax=Streptomyces albus TaxID=1888 RepID=UPI00156F4661
MAESAGGRERAEPARTAEALAAHFGLEPLPREGGRFRRTWAGPEREDGRPEGSAIVMLLTSAPDDYCALHRLPTDEVWHHYLGDPLELLLLPGDSTAPGPHPAGTRVLGPDVLGAGHQVQLTVPAGTWMGARVAPGGAWTLFGCTMAPGYTDAGYEHGDAEALARRFPEHAGAIRRLGR